MVATGGQSREGLGSVLVTPGGRVVGSARVVARGGRRGTSRREAEESQRRAQEEAQRKALESQRLAEEKKAQEAQARQQRAQGLQQRVLATQKREQQEPSQRLLTAQEATSRGEFRARPLPKSPLERSKRFLTKQRDVGLTESQLRKQTLRGQASSFGAGVGTSLILTAEFAKGITTDLPGTVSQTVSAIPQIPTALRSVGPIIRDEPAFATGFLATEVATARGLGKVKPKQLSPLKIRNEAKQFERMQRLQKQMSVSNKVPKGRRTPLTTTVDLDKIVQERARTLSEAGIRLQEKRLGKGVSFTPTAREFARSQLERRILERQRVTSKPPVLPKEPLKVSFTPASKNFIKGQLQQRITSRIRDRVTTPRPKQPITVSLDPDFIRTQTRGKIRVVNIDKGVDKLITPQPRFRKRKRTEPLRVSLDPEFIQRVQQRQQARLRSGADIVKLDSSGTFKIQEAQPRFKQRRGILVSSKEQRRRFQVPQRTQIKSFREISAPRPQRETTTRPRKQTQQQVLVSPQQIQKQVQQPKIRQQFRQQQDVVSAVSQQQQLKTVQGFASRSRQGLRLVPLLKFAQAPASAQAFQQRFAQDFSPRTRQDFGSDLAFGSRVAQRQDTLLREEEKFIPRLRVKTRGRGRSGLKTRPVTPSTKPPRREASVQIKSPGKRFQTIGRTRTAQEALSIGKSQAIKTPGQQTIRIRGSGSVQTPKGFKRVAPRTFKEKKRRSKK